PDRRAGGVRARWRPAAPKEPAQRVTPRQHDAERPNQIGLDPPPSADGRISAEIAGGDRETPNDHVEAARAGIAAALLDGASDECDILADTVVAAVLHPFLHEPMYFDN